MMPTPLMPQSNPDAAAPPEAPEDMSQGYCIEICVLPDGTFTVASEPLPEEAQEEQGAPGSEAGQPAKSIGDALKIALDIFKADGKSSNRQADFMAGYNGDQQPTPKSGGM